MNSIHPLRALRQTWIDVGTAVNAAREYRQDGAARSATLASANPQTAAIAL
ncbi:MAG: hypothetical protein ACK4QP_17030 [Pseudorhizobium sp.]